MTRSISQHSIDVDIAIIGGGINGVGIARDASLRGLRVALCDKGDLGSATSSASSQLAHGGLRYLEYGEFRLVREALRERETLLNIAPHLVRPLSFVIPHHPSMRPLWQMRIGLWLYDHLANHQSLSLSKVISLSNNLYANPLVTSFNKACLFNDCWVDDARLVISNAKAAHQQGTHIFTHTECTNAISQKEGWKLTLQSAQQNKSFHINARVLINAAGPWVDHVQQHVIGLATQHHIRPVKGSHIVLPRFYQGQHAYLLQVSDKRIIFTIPLDKHIIVGTTDLAYTDNLNKIKISQQEITYLLDALKLYFKQEFSHNDIVYHYAGVRPLIAQANQTLSANSRDYVLELQTSASHPPLLTVFGGKITTYRHLAESALNKLKKYLPAMQSVATADTPLPGGNLPHGNIDTFYQTISHHYSWLPEALQKQYVDRYGSDIHNLLTNCNNMTDLGKEISPNLYERELVYLRQHEWAITADDILWRRTKLGLHYSQTERAAVATWLENN